MQLAEKQKARFTYGLGERQFRNIYLEASRREGVTGLNMLQYIELRLDNIVYRAAWAATRPQARQLVSHGHVEVNGKRVNIASYRVRKGDVVSLRPKTRESVLVPLEHGRARSLGCALVRYRRGGSSDHCPRSAATRAHRHAGTRADDRRALLQVIPAAPLSRGGARNIQTTSGRPEGRLRNPRRKICWSSNVRRSKR
jgi:ribosomal protein S4